MPAQFTLPPDLMPTTAPGSASMDASGLAGRAVRPALAVSELVLPVGGLDVDAWLTVVRQRWQAGHLDSAVAAVMAAAQAFPDRPEPILEWASMEGARGRLDLAEQVLRKRAVLPTVALALAVNLRDQGRFEAACGVIDAALARKPATELCLPMCVFLEQCGRQGSAFQWYAQRAKQSDAGAADLANAGRLATVMGEFESARGYYERALAIGLNCRAWSVAEALAMCQRYDHADHPDIVLFRRWLDDAELTASQRAGVLFALGKADDDLGLYQDAAACWAEANALLRAVQPWDADAWSRAVAPGGDWARVPRAGPGPSPVFVVGMPRSGTTLVAELLARRKEVRNRGELIWIPELCDRIVRQGVQKDPTSLGDVAGHYLRMLVQDDAPARWYVDKQTFNFLYLDMLAALFPQAHVVYCTRDPRDVALSLWSQRFVSPAAAFASSFDDIATVAASCTQLMQRWSEQPALPVHTVSYESLVASPDEVMADLCRQIGIADERDSPATDQAAERVGAVATASMWQVRQPVDTHSVGRWQRYERYIPELATKFAPQ